VQIALLLFGAWLAFRSRNIHSSFNESKFIGLSIYNFLIAMVLTIPFIILNGSDPTNMAIIVFLGVFWFTTGSLALLL
jgi:hypothetical protein